MKYGLTHLSNYSKKYILYDGKTYLKIIYSEVKFLLHFDFHSKGFSVTLLYQTKQKALAML